MSDYGVHKNEAKFIEYVEKKLRKTIREIGGLEKDAKIVCSDFTFEVLKRILNLPFSRSDKGVQILDWFIEDEDDWFLNKISSTKQEELVEGIKLYIHFEYATIKQYANAIKLDLPVKKFSKNIKRLEKLSSLYPETKFSLAKTIQKLNK